MGTQHAKPPIEPQQFARNGQYPDALLQNEIADLANKLALYRMKQVFHGQTNMNAITAAPGASTERPRWRFAFHSSQYSAAILVRAWMAPTTLENLTDDPYARVRIQTATPTTLGDAEIHFGNSAAGTATDVSPSKLASMWTLLSSAGAIANPAADTAYFGTVSDFQSRIVAVTVYEVSWATAPPFSEGYALTSKIFDTDRSTIAAAARLMWKQQAAQLFNWSVDQDSVARTRILGTSINAIDNTSTAVSAATPGFTLDLRNRNRYNATTVPVTLKAYAKISAGSTTGVKLKDSGGATVASITVNSATAAWFSTTANLPNTLAKYDLHYESDGTNTLTLYSVSCYQYTIGS